MRCATTIILSKVNSFCAKILLESSCQNSAFVTYCNKYIHPFSSEIPREMNTQHHSASFWTKHNPLTTAWLRIVKQIRTNGSLLYCPRWHKTQLSPFVLVKQLLAVATACTGRTAASLRPPTGSGPTSSPAVSPSSAARGTAASLGG